MYICKNEKELGEALKAEASRIEITGPLVQKVLKIKKVSSLSWKIAIGALGVAVGAALTVPVAGGPVIITVVPTLSFILGGKVAVCAVLIAVAAGGVGVLNSLRSYQIEVQEADRLVLVRK